jgi:hypothetical protein
MKPPFVPALLASLVLTGLARAETPLPRIVMTWVPPYAIEKSRARLEENVDGLGAKDALTHLALQFWLPTREGGVEKTPKYATISDAIVIRFRDWAHAHGIRVLLCVYNYADAWDWTLAEAGFAKHREAFVAALLAETERLGLDGVDVDLEGNGEFAASKDAFIAFARDLSGKLHGAGKKLTIDSFADKWNAPNQTWWSELFPLVDAINSMGYEYIGAHGTEWRAYAAQKAAAGANAPKLLLGVPGSKEQWLGNTAAEHMDWIAHDSTVGVSIWDAQFGASYWKTAGAWKTLIQIKGGR